MDRLVVGLAGQRQLVILLVGNPDLVPNLGRYNFVRRILSEGPAVIIEGVRRTISRAMKMSARSSRVSWDGEAEAEAEAAGTWGKA